MQNPNRPKLVFLFSVFFVLAFTASVSASVIKPLLNIQTLSVDMGISSNSGALSMDATATTISTDGGSVDIPNVDFSLTAQYNNSPAAGSYVFNNGSLTIGSLLTADFSSLTILYLDSGMMGDMGQFYADLTYTGGSLKGSLSNGRIEGVFYYASQADFSSNFTASPVIAAVGPVAPVPAAIWLLGSGLIGVVGVRRKFGDMQKN